MKSLTKAGSRVGVAAGVCACALACAAGPAPAAVGGPDANFPESSLVIDASGPFVQGKAFHVLVTGSNGVPDGSGDLVGFDLDLYLLAAKVGTCPMVQQGMVQLVKQHPQDTEILFGGQPVPEASVGPSLDGPFTLPIFTASAGDFTGSLYICGYSIYGGTEDAAWYSFGPVTIKPGAGGSAGGSMGTSGTRTGPASPGKPGKPGKPEAIAPPRVARKGSRLVCDRGRWSGAPASYSYRWTVTKERGSASLTSRLAVTRGMRGHQAACSVTATNSKGSTTATSRPVKLA